MKLLQVEKSSSWLVSSVSRACKVIIWNFMIIISVRNSPIGPSNNQRQTFWSYFRCDDSKFYLTLFWDYPQCTVLRRKMSLRIFCVIMLRSFCGINCINYFCNLGGNDTAAELRFHLLAPSSVRTDFRRVTRPPPIV